MCKTHPEHSVARQGETLPHDSQAKQYVLHGSCTVAVEDSSPIVKAA